VRGTERGNLSERICQTSTVIPAKRSASRNPGRFAGYALNLQQHHLDSRPGLLFAGVTFLRGNDGTEVKESVESTLF